MFSKTLVLSALAALATAQSAVLSFTNVPNPVTDGQAQAITFRTNDTSSVSTCDESVNRVRANEQRANFIPAR